MSHDLDCWLKFIWFVKFLFALPYKMDTLSFEVGLLTSHLGKSLYGASSTV